MSEMSKTPSNATTKISSFVLMIIFIALALSLAALGLAIYFQSINYPEYSGVLILIGFLGVAMSAYVLFQTRRRILRLKIEAPSITTTIECKKCGLKSVREFQRGDYVFREAEPCQKCSDKMLITAIYREVKEKGKEGVTP
jgi:multidrug transporter EmrE-like cation transporter